jgi:hypothetical protein
LKSNRVCNAKQKAEKYVFLAHFQEFFVNLISRTTKLLEFSIFGFSKYMATWQHISNNIFKRKMIILIAKTSPYCTKTSHYSETSRMGVAKSIQNLTKKMCVFNAPMGFFKCNLLWLWSSLSNDGPYYWWLSDPCFRRRAAVFTWGYSRGDPVLVWPEHRFVMQLNIM